MKAISKDMRYAIQTYYFNRLRAIVESRKWDKQADLDAIAAVARKAGWVFEAAAGTMWFSYSTKTTWVTHRTSISLFPQFTVERKKHTKEP